MPAAIPAPPVPDPFGDYWYQGEAELTSYTLEQARYGEVHPGHAVLIYVTEPFSKSKQVKLDRAGQTPEDEVTVMKLNFTKNFNTGIYPYSMMASVFTPIERADHPHTLKVTTTSQEWCGHTFMQLNHMDAGYRAEVRSYFESEGDQNLTVPAALLEDELWTIIRLNPDGLPTGEIELLPGTMFQRLGHVESKVQRAIATLTDAPDQPDQQVYTLTYPDLGRTLAIRFNKAFPFEIEGWTETRGTGARSLTTRATRNERMMLDYWARNGLADAPLRAELGL